VDLLPATGILRGTLDGFGPVSLRWGPGRRRSHREGEIPY
jgi:hypothetical protein